MVRLRGIYTCGEVFGLQPSSLSAEVPIEQETQRMQQVRLARIVLTDEACDTVLGMNVEMPKVAEVLHEQTADVHFGSQLGSCVRGKP